MTIDQDGLAYPAPALRDTIANLLANANDAAFFFDFDGTLVDIAATPDAVVVAPQVPALLAELAAGHGGAVAVLTGRALATVDHFLAPLRLPGCGQHGLELRLPDGALASPRSAAEIAPVRHRLAALAPTLPTGVTIEDKGLSIAVHYRDNPAAAAAIEAVVAAAAADAVAPVLVRQGKMVIEITLAGATKGTALRRLMQSRPFAGRRAIVFGDDITDDAAFVAARDLGGVSFQVGPRSDHAADHELCGPADVHWLIRDFAATRHAISQAAP